MKELDLSKLTDKEIIKQANFLFCKLWDITNPEKIPSLTQLEVLDFNQAKLDFKVVQAFLSKCPSVKELGFYGVQAVDLFGKTSLEPGGTQELTEKFLSVIKINIKDSHALRQYNEKQLKSIFPNLEEIVH